LPVRRGRDSGEIGRAITDTGEVEVVQGETVAGDQQIVETHVAMADPAARTVLSEVVPYSVAKCPEQVFLRGRKQRAEFVETV
jgi:hypothetical protein